MKLGPVTKLDEGNKKNVKKIKDDVISKIYDVIAIFPSYDQFGAIQKLDCRCILQKLKTKLKNL